jgi:putative addiction module component (TIGR02574 family)
MSTAEVMEMALRLKASERYELLEMLQKSLDKPDPEIDRVWIGEAERRLQAYREGKLEVISMEEVFSDVNT